MGIRLAAAVCVWTVLFVSAATAAQPGPASTRETYEVSLARTSGYLRTAHGRTVVETREACGDTSTVQRSLADVTYQTGEAIRTDFITRTWESSDHRTLRFDVQNIQSGNGAERHTGTARLFANGTGQVTFTSADKPFSLPAGTLFPGAFSRVLLAAAAKGQDVGSRPVFQGGGKSALVTTAVRIGRRVANPRETAKDPHGLLKGAAWPILISYFPDQTELAASEVAAHLYANGLLGSLSFVYPPYTLRARLVRVERLARAANCAKP
jgi:EipB-like